MNKQLEEIKEIRELFLDEVDEDETKCPYCGSYDTLNFEDHRTCYECNTLYRVLKFQRAIE